METYLSEVYRLHIGVPLKEQPHIISGIRGYIQRVSMCYKLDVRVLFLEDLYGKSWYYTGKSAVMFLLESLHVGEPAYGISNGSVGVLDKNIFFISIIVVYIDGLSAVIRMINRYPVVDKVLFSAADICPGLHISIVHDGSSLGICKYKMVFCVACRELYSKPVIEVEPYAFNCFLCRKL